MSERRESVRVGDDLQIRTRTKDGELAFAAGGALSETGLFVEYVLPYEPGTRLHVEFFLPGQGSVSVDAEVASAQTFLPSDFSVKPGNGLRFVNLDAGGRRKVRMFISEQLG